MLEESPLRSQILKAAEFELSEYEFRTTHSIGSLLKERRKVALALIEYQNEVGIHLFEHYNNQIKQLLAL